MYHCKDCGKDFESPQKCKENDTELLTISRTYYVCPNCESSNIDEKIIKYCRCCGRSIGFKNSDYCSLACRRRGEKIFENERRKNLHIKSSPIYETARKLQQYNKEHNTNLTYGQFATLILPKLQKEM